MNSIEQVINLLNEKHIIGRKGSISFEMLGIKNKITTKDIIGSVLQDWLGIWLHRNGINWSGGPHTQSWPDFILPGGEHLEFKAFDGAASPNFDLANFDAYTRSLLENSERLDTDHLVFEYELANANVIIKNYWVKKIWEMTGPSETNILNLQVKQGSPVNIRPKNWRTNRVEIFKTRRDFVEALHMAICRFHPDRYENWMKAVEEDYFRKNKRKI